MQLEPQVEKLVDCFQSQGWSLLGPIDISTDWWFKEIIQFVSDWHPVDTNMYMTLLTEPEHLHKKIVWSIGISSTIPDNRHFKFVAQLSINDIKRTDLKAFVDHINSSILI